jgi:drug/metabolite transporter (DMT)-like permease
VYFMISERYTRTMGSVAFTVYSMTGACGALIAWYFSRHPPDLPMLAPGSWPDMAALVVIGTVAGVFVTAEGVRRIGAQRSAIVSTTGPPAAALLGWLFLGETMHAPQWIGMALIVGGILVLDFTRRPAPPAE